MQFPKPWGLKRFDYTAVEVKKDVMETKLKAEMPKPLSLTKCADMLQKEGLHVKDMLYVVHYPRDEKYARCLNGEHIRVLDGKLVKCGVIIVKVPVMASSAYTTIQSQNLTFHLLSVTGPYIGHSATTFAGSSGSPILREYNNELVVVGLHRSGIEVKDGINIATHIHVIVDDIQGKSYEGKGE